MIVPPEPSPVVAESAAAAASPGTAPPCRAGRTLEVVVPAGDRTIDATLSRPAEAVGLVLIAGGGTARRARAARTIAARLQRAGLATLLFDLLDPAEACRRASMFDVEELAARLLQVVRWAESEPLVASLPLGVLAAGTAAAAALDAAAREPLVRALVCCGARTDLALDEQSAVVAPVLLLVGARDPDVLALNRRAMGELAGVRRLVVVPGATHRLSEPAAAEQVAAQAEAWMLAFLPSRPRSRIRPAPAEAGTTVAPMPSTPLAEPPRP